MPGTAFDTISWDDQKDLNSWEKEAVEFYLEYPEDVQYFLRHPREMAVREERSSFQVLLSHIDNAISRSGIPEGRLLFRGIQKDLLQRLMFLLSIDHLDCRDGEFKGITPQIIHDKGYTSFTTNPATILRDTKGQLRAMLVYQTEISDRALFIGREETEVVYPRSVMWVATGFVCIKTGRVTTVLIGIQQYKGGGEAWT